MIGMRRLSLSLLHLVLGEDPFARALCGTKPYGKRGRGWAAPLDEPPTCRVCAGKRWLSQNRRTRSLFDWAPWRDAQVRLLPDAQRPAPTMMRARRRNSAG